jgi:hypothetical protein
MKDIYVLSILQAADGNSESRELARNRWQAVNKDSK